MKTSSGVVAEHPLDAKEPFDLIIIGAGGAGEAAAHLASGRGARVAIVDRALFGGSCPFWACMPTKALLHAASVHARGGDYPWSKASAFRDYMINREGTDAPDDGGHVRSLEGAGVTVIRGDARFAAPGRISVSAADGSAHELAARAVIVAVGSHSTVPDLPGLVEAGYWTNVQGTSTRELPESIVILGGGPTGAEMAQVYARYGVPVTLVHSRERILHQDHPRNSALVAAGLERDGVTIRTGVTATSVIPAPTPGGKHRICLSDETSVEGHQIMLAIGRSYPTEDLNLKALGLDGSQRPVPDERLRIAPDVYVVGDVAGPEMHTHLAHYQGEMAARIALGDDVKPDHSAIPRGLYTDPEVASVGLQLEQALEAGIDAREISLDLAHTAKGYTAEAEGHVTIVIDAAMRRLVGAFIGGPGAAEAIHEAVLAIKTRTPLGVLADTIHAFPTVARVLGTAFAQADREVGASGVSRLTADRRPLVRR
jgi:pyruvate/2-oxoglutarate dehydrogenase complex dihydrolipoamide dehydrogenase (E3) component